VLPVTVLVLSGEPRTTASASGCLAAALLMCILFPPLNLQLGFSGADVLVSLVGKRNCICIIIFDTPAIMMVMMVMAIMITITT
jgi:hypothetical protein